MIKQFSFQNNFLLVVCEVCNTSTYYIYQPQMSDVVQRKPLLPIPSMPANARKPLLPLPPYPPNTAMVCFNQVLYTLTICNYQNASMLTKDFHR